MRAPYQLFDPLPAEQYDALKADIARRGVLVPVEYDEAGNILDGHHRAQIAAELGIDHPRVTRDGLDEQEKTEHVLKLNLLRRHLGPVSWAEAFKRLCESRGVQLGQGARNDRTSDTVSEVAQELGVNERTARRRLKLADELSGYPELAAEVDRGEVGAFEARVRLRESRNVELKTRPVTPPEGRFATIVADPPWPMTFIHRYVRDLQPGLGYPTMTPDELREFGQTVDTVAADDCHLYLWTTHKHLPLALELADRWGFRYECLLTWIKPTGMAPYSFMRTTELVLFCRRGNLRLKRLGLPVHFEAPRIGHSVKPEAFFELVREVSPGPRIELFARQPHDGFTAWGNEVDERAS